MGIGAADRRRQRELLRGLSGSQRAERGRVSGVLAVQSLLDQELHRGGAAQFAIGAYRADQRDVGHHQRGLARAAGSVEQGHVHPRGTGEIPALRAGDLAALRRLRLPHHAAQRRLLVLAAGPASGARRQHRTHPRCQIPRAAAGRRACWRAARFLPMDLDPALGLGNDRLSLGLSRDAEAVADRGSADPQRLAAALAGELLRQPRAQSRPDRRRLWPPGRGAAPCPRRPQPARALEHERHLPARRARVHPGIHRGQLATRRNRHPAIFDLMSSSMLNMLLRHSGAMRKHRARNLEIPGLALARHPGMTR